MAFRTTLGGLALLWLAGTASAQANSQPPREAEAAAPLLEEHELEGEAGADDDEAQNPMGWLGIGFKVGIGRIHSSRIQNPVYDASLAQAASMLDEQTRTLYGLDDRGACTIIKPYCETAGRFGLQLSVPIQLGGDGFGWDIEPYFASAPGTKAYGGYTGPKFDIHVADPLYLGFGFGFKAAWLVADGWDYGADLYGRIPVRGTLYLVDDLALVVEFAFGAGGTGYASESTRVVDPRTGQSFATSPSLNFGSGRTWDLSIGLRLP